MPFYRISLALRQIGVGFRRRSEDFKTAKRYTSLPVTGRTAQLVSYEVALSFALLSGLMVAGTLSMQGIVRAQQERHIWFIFENYWFMADPTLKHSMREESVETIII